MREVGPKDPQGYYILKVPKSKVEVIKGGLSGVEIISIDDENVLVRSKSRKTILNIVKSLNR